MGQIIMTNNVQKERQGYAVYASLPQMITPYAATGLQPDGMKRFSVSLLFVLIGSFSLVLLD